MALIWFPRVHPLLINEVGGQARYLVRRDFTAASSLYSRECSIWPTTNMRQPPLGGFPKSQRGHMSVVQQGLIVAQVN